MSESSPADHPRKSTTAEPAARFFFPAAAALAALLIPLTLQGWLSGWPLPPGLRSSTGHAHEMLFGFALAVMTGFLLNRVPRPLFLAMIASWLAARAGWLFWPGSWLSALCDLAFAGLLLKQALPQFLVAVKKWRNHATTVALVGMALALALFQTALLADKTGWVAPVRSAAVLILCLLMSFMGGRIIAPAVAGHLQTKQRNLAARVQPRIEGALLVVLLLALVLQAAGLEWPTALTLLLAAGLILVRWLRWQWWHCLDRPDLLALAVGYLWLCIGLVWLALETLGSHPMRPVALHGLTVGALGCLTLSVMARSHAVRNKFHPSRAAIALPLTGLLSLSAILRMTEPAPPLGLLASAWLWSAAFAALGVYFLRVRKKTGPMKKRDQVSS